MIAKNSDGQKSFDASAYILPISILAIVITAVVTILFWSHTWPNQSTYESRSGVPNLLATSDLYLVVREANNLNRVVRLEPDSGTITNSFDVGYNSVVKLTSDQKILYVFNQPLEQAEVGQGRLSAVDPATGNVQWEIVVPGIPFSGLATTGAWLSEDERTLYLQASPNGLDIHILTIDLPSKSLTHDVELPLPFASNQGFPLTWKLPWAESLVVVSQNQLFTFDLISEQVSTSLYLDQIVNSQRIPKNFPRYFFVQAGVINPDTQQLILAAASQEIISVNLSAEPFVTKSVFSVPGGWQFGGSHLLVLNAEENALYVQVKRTNTPIVNGSEAEGVWALDLSNWSRKFQVNLPDYLAPNQQGSGSQLDLTSYDLAVSNDGQGMYMLTAKGILHVGQDSNGDVHANWLMDIGDLPSLLRYEVIK